MSLTTDKKMQPHARAFRIAALCWLLGWYIKAGFQVPYLFIFTQKYPVVYSFFPPVFLDPTVAITAYFMPLLAGVLVFSRRKIYLNLAVIIMLVSSIILNLHINTCNDATYVTSFWTALWLLWLIRHLEENSAEFYLQARVLAQCVVGMIFWGGFIGKLTPEYWSGDVVSKIFIIQPNGSPIGQFLLSLPEVSRQQWIVWVARGSIIAELFLALAPFWPYRFFVFITIPLFFCISLFSTWMIFSVLLCLAGILAAGLLLNKKDNLERLS